MAVAERSWQDQENGDQLALRSLITVVCVCVLGGATRCKMQRNRGGGEISIAALKYVSTYLARFRNWRVFVVAYRSMQKRKKKKKKKKKYSQRVAGLGVHQGRFPGSFSRARSLFEELNCFASRLTFQQIQIRGRYSGRQKEAKVNRSPTTKSCWKWSSTFI